ncbi:hypothetical protein ACN8ZM_39815 (plasmid) [Burkholderia aenigmatica]|uniref:hypothetical protein n=1 Tax=Burkholderia aenigmatica TaxID=2015348 RepID=UPI003B4383AA
MKEATKLQVVVQPIPSIKVRADGDANFYHLLDGNDWVAAIQLNGKFTTPMQEAMMQKLADVLKGETARELGEGEPTTESYCQQVCGGGECGAGPVCQHGIDPTTELPVVAYDGTLPVTQHEDDEVIGLDANGYVQQWDGKKGVPYTSGESLEEWGLHNLREHEVARVGVTFEAWKAAVAGHERKLPESTSPMLKVVVSFEGDESGDGCFSNAHEFPASAVETHYGMQWTAQDAMGRMSLAEDYALYAFYRRYGDHRKLRTDADITSINAATMAIWKADGTDQAGKLPELNLVVDGTDETGNFEGDGNNAPFVVFDIDRQENVAGPFGTREAGEEARTGILGGAVAAFDSATLLAIVEARDNGNSAELSELLKALDGRKLPEAPPFSREELERLGFTFVAFSQGGWGYSFQSEAYGNNVCFTDGSSERPFQFRTEDSVIHAANEVWERIRLGMACDVRHQLENGARKLPDLSHTEIRLPVYDIVITLSSQGVGAIRSSLHDEGESSEGKAALDGVEAMILAHAVAGIDVKSPVYLDGVETAVEAIWNHLGDVPGRKLAGWQELNDLADQAAEAALNAGCKAVQDTLGVTTGDVAARHFSDEVVHTSLAKALLEYAQAEQKALALNHAIEKQSSAPSPRT